MPNTYIFLRHTKVRKDTDAHSETWVLSEEGIKFIEEVAATGIFDNVERIITSSQKKCIQTAYFLAERLGKDIITNPGLNEIDKGANLIEEPEEYEEQVKKVFENYSESVGGWEPANQAFRRFQVTMDRIEQEYRHNIILIVTHGIVLTLYFNHLLKENQGSLFPRWKALKSCAWGRVKDNEVLRDIVL